MPLCDSSETYTRAVRLKPSPAVLQLTFTAGIPEVSRFSCMKFLGVSGVFDYAGLSGSSR
jgi:ABC-type transporter lipoprotein component MlaA